MLASRNRGAPSGLRSHPSNLIRVMPAKGAATARSAGTDDRDLRQRRRRRHPGRPQGVRRRRGLRHLGARRADSAEHEGRHGDPRAAAGLRRRSARRSLRRHRRRRGQDGMLFSRALIETVAGLPRGASGAARRRPGHGRELGRKLLEDDAVGALVGRLFPLAAVVTPNLLEAVALAGVRRLAARARRARCTSSARAAVVVTGGHGEPRSTTSSTARGTSRSPSRATRSAPRTAPGARTRRRSRRCSPAGCRSRRRRGAPPRPPLRRCAHGLEEIGAGDGPVDVLNLREPQ